MVLLPLEPESSASAYSAISANIKFIGQPRPRDSCGYPKFSSAWSANQISTAAPLLCSLYLPQAALTGKLPIPPYPQILNLSGNRARVTLAVDVIFYGLERRSNFDRCAFALFAFSATGSAHRQTAYSTIPAY